MAVDWLGRNLYWIDGVKSQIVAIRLAKNTVKSREHSAILDEDLDQPRSLALLPQKGSARVIPKSILKILEKARTSCAFSPSPS